MSVVFSGTVPSVSGVMDLGRPVGRPVAVVVAEPVWLASVVDGWTRMVVGSHVSEAASEVE